MTDKIESLQQELETLPVGYISNKRINGVIRHYLQWTDQNGKIKSKYIPDSEYEELKAQMERKKEIQAELKKIGISKSSRERKTKSYEMNVLVGEELKKFVDVVKGFKKRDCFDSLLTFLYGKITPRVCSIYGLRRTGKTTLLQQAIREMKSDDFKKAAYIKAKKGQTMSMLDRDMKDLQKNGYIYIFIDEITFLEDFVDTASFLSDVYAAMGMKIVLSGTDSLGFWFANHEELYDRAYTIHTTWIPYAEHARLLDINDIDEYIRYGGTLRVGETDFGDKELRSEDVSFRDDESTRRYIDTAICKNIQHSLKCYESGIHFRHLQELYENNELTSAINRVIEDMTHRFVIKVIEDNFKSSDLSLARKNMLRERNPQLRNDILERINSEQVTKILMDILEIKNSDNRRIRITEAHTQEIFEYLLALELVGTYNVRYANINSETGKNILITQPGMRYCQAQALVYSLKKDEIFSELNDAEMEYVCNRILDDVKGRMLEEIVLFETISKFKDGFEVFKYRFARGEFDMVIYNKNEHSCRIFEIKHSQEIVKEQCKNLLDEEMCKATENKFGEITNKSVIYRGNDTITELGIEYLNVSNFLRSLSDQ